MTECETFESTTSDRVLIYSVGFPNIALEGRMGFEAISGSDVRYGLISFDADGKENRNRVD